MDNPENVETQSERVALEATETPDGRMVVQAEGSVWKLYFPAGKTPTEDQMRVASGGLGAIKTMQAGNIAYTGWDGSADAATTDIVNFTGQSIIDARVRADTVANAQRADAFNERVETEMQRLVAEREIALEAASKQKIMDYEQQAIEADQRAVAAEAARDQVRLEITTLRAEAEFLQRVVDAAQVAPEVIENVRTEDAEKLVLSGGQGGAIVEVEGESPITDVEHSDTIVQSEERKA